MRVFQGVQHKSPKEHHFKAWAPKGAAIAWFLAEIEKGYNSTSFFFFFFFLATIDNVNVYGFYSTYFKEAKNHFE